MESRCQRARRLVRRVRGQGSLPDTEVGWSSLGAIWVHLGLFGALVLLPPPHQRAGAPAGAPTERRIVVARADVEPAPGSTARAPARGPDQPPSAAPGELEPAAPADRPASPPSDRFARTSADDAVEVAPDRADAVSAHHTRSDTPRAAPITSRREGLPTPISNGDSDLSSAPTWERVPGDHEPALGNRSDGDPAPVPIGGGGGGERRDGAGPGSPGVGDGANPGGAAQGARGAIAAGRAGGRGEEAHAGAPVGLEPSRSAGDRPGWWEPLVVRWSSPPSSPGPAVAARDRGAAPAVGVAEVDRALTRDETGGTEVPTGSSAPLPTERAAAPGTRRIAAPGTADPVAELRLALGFGPLDRSELAPRPEWAGRDYEAGLADSSPQTAFAEAAIDWRTALSTEGTPLGAYVQRAEELIAARWSAADLDTHSRGIGLQGDVTVRFVVHPDGRTTDVSVVRSSGNIVLDDLAAGAIPPRLARFPKDLEKEPYVHELTLHYRNPSITP